MMNRNRAPQVSTLPGELALAVSVAGSVLLVLALLGQAAGVNGEPVQNVVPFGEEAPRLPEPAGGTARAPEAPPAPSLVKSVRKVLRAADALLGPDAQGADLLALSLAVAGR